MTELRVTGPNGDGEYWLHIKAGGKMGGVNLGAAHGPLVQRLLDAAAIEAPVQEPVGWTGNGSLMAVQDGREGYIFKARADAHPIPLYTAPQPDETAALRAKLAEVERERDEALKAEAVYRRKNHKLTATRAEERKLADDLAASLAEVSARCGPLSKDGKTAKSVLAAHAARRKPLAKGCLHTNPCTCGEP